MAYRNENLYFAYGSNLWIEQMAKRCPGSSFKGKGTLEGYRWQINQRGVANVVKAAPSDSVEGLVFSVTTSDERTLDRNEGVAKKFYERQFLTITLEEHPLHMNQKTSQVARWLEHNRDNTDAKIYLSGSRAERCPALVYISERYNDDGPIREEYIKRMQSAATDAIALGVSRSWIDRAMGPFINHPRADSPLAQLPVQYPSRPTERLDRPPADRSGARKRSAIDETMSGGRGGVGAIVAVGGEGYTASSSSKKPHKSSFFGWRLFDMFLHRRWKTTSSSFRQPPSQTPVRCQPASAARVEPQERRRQRRRVPSGHARRREVRDDDTRRRGGGGVSRARL